MNGDNQMQKLMVGLVLLLPVFLSYGMDNAQEKAKIALAGNASTILHSGPFRFMKLDHTSKPLSFKNELHRRALRGTGFALEALEDKAVNLQKKQDNNQKLEPYKNPYEAQRKKYYAEILAKPWGQVSKKYIDALEAEEKGLIAEFLAITGMSIEQWEEKKAILFQYVKHNETRLQSNYLKKYGFVENKKLIDPEVNERIDFYLKKYELDFMVVVGPNDDLSSLAVSSTSKVLICSANALKNCCYPANPLKIDNACLHEMQHVFHSDDFMRNIMMYCTIKDTNTYLDGHEFLFKISKFYEKRADMLAALNTLDKPSFSYESLKDLPLIGKPEAVKLFVANFVTEALLLKFIDKMGIVTVPTAVIFAASTISFIGGIMFMQPHNIKGQWTQVNPSKYHPSYEERSDYLIKLHQEILAAIEKNKQKTA